MNRLIGAAVMLASVAAAGAASAQGLDFLHAQRAEGGRLCFTDHFHYGTGSGPTRAAAEKDAVASWSGFTSLEYGNIWGYYKLAGSKKMDCSQSGGSWSCNAEARPCRPLTGGGAARPGRRRARS